MPPMASFGYNLPPGLCDEVAWPGCSPQAARVGRQIELAKLVDPEPAATVRPICGERAAYPWRGSPGMGGESGSLGTLCTTAFSAGSAGHPLHCGGGCGYFRRAKGCKAGATCPDCHICWPSEGSTGHPLHCKPACKFNFKARGCWEGKSCKCCHICIWSRKADPTSQSDGSEATRGKNIRLHCVDNISNTALAPNSENSEKTELVRVSRECVHRPEEVDDWDVEVMKDLDVERLDEDDDLADLVEQAEVQHAEEYQGSWFPARRACLQACCKLVALAEEENDNKAAEAALAGLMQIFQIPSEGTKNVIHAAKIFTQIAEKINEKDAWLSAFYSEY